MLKFRGYSWPYVMLESDVPVKVEHEPFDRKLMKNDTYELFYKKTNIPGLYDYGYKQLIDTWDHKAGYVWASRPSCLNSVFGTRFITCLVGCQVFALDVEVLEELLKSWPEPYEIIEERDDDEISYELRKIKK